MEISSIISVLLIVIIPLINLTGCTKLSTFQGRFKLRTLLIDNYDSYTYNLWQYLAELNGENPYVINNDAFYGSWDSLVHELDLYNNFDNIVISPGPGNPERKKDFGLCRDAILKSKMPILGVCLGHQGMAAAYGGRVVKGKEPMHGRLSLINHDNEGIFSNIYPESLVVRYHSLVVDSLPDELIATAWDENGVIMGIRHKSKHQYGVQFHPESVKTIDGKKMLENFRDITIQWREQNPDSGNSRSAQSHRDLSGMARVKTALHSKRQVLTIQSFKPEEGKAWDLCDVFDTIYGDYKHSIFLDAQCSGPIANHLEIPEESCSKREQISIMAALDTPDAHLLTYKGSESGTSIFHGNGSSSVIDTSLMSFLREKIEEAKGTETIDLSRDNSSRSLENLSLTSGYFGYLGYELGRELIPGLKNTSAERILATGASESSLPMALLLHPTRFLAFDHKEKAFYVISTVQLEGDLQSESEIERAKLLAEERCGAIIFKLELFFSRDSVEPDPATSPEIRSPERPVLTAWKSDEAYRQDIQKCLQEISEGETYEVCLTVQFSGPLRREHRNFLSAYKKLRLANPAPHSAFIRSQAANTGKEFAICCTSPEQYLRIDKTGKIVSKPIKGTARRIKDDPVADLNLVRELFNDEKTQAENLMITDLVRNDLGRICKPGTVSVPRLFDIESYESVHQMVTTVEGQIRSDLNIVDAIEGTFPGGSMTGAPKLRTMQLLETLEPRSRGVYSGSIGYVGLNNGIADLNIVIRTAVLHEDQITIGAGGAIVALSEPANEVDEVLLKAQSVANCLGYKVSFPSK